jgi:NADH-quinone oxidoreductase subunit L
MSYPLILLAVLAAIGGFVVFEGVGKALGLGSGFLRMVESTIEADPKSFHFDVVFAVISTALVLVGLGAARQVWAAGLAGDAALAERSPFLHRLFRNKFYIDDFYQWCINHIVLAFGRFIALFDRVVVNDTGVNGAGEFTFGLGWLFRYLQSGKLPNYALGMALGLTVIAIVGFSVK